VALVGDPVAHSASPAIHAAAFIALGLDLEYVSVRIIRDDLAEAFPVLRRTFLGLNVTRPLKEAILPLLDDVSPEAAAAGSVNTVVFRDGRAEGHSTDGAGFLAALERSGASGARRALILGTGGAARAVAAALLETGAAVLVSGRNAEAGRRLVDDLSAARTRGAGGDHVEFLSAEPLTLAREVELADLLVNATPVGGWPDIDRSPLPEEVPLRPGHTVFDLVYRPRRTRLLDRASAAGCHVVEGIEMLIEQGARSFSIWTGLEAPVEVMRQAAYRTVEASHARETPELGNAEGSFREISARRRGSG
jgi:shikimate dehydrogenase